MHPHPRTGGRSRAPAALAATIAIVVCVVSVLLALASPASAHAVVVSTNPTDGQVLPQSPETVQIQFNEGVSIALGGLTVLNSDGEVVSDGQGTLSAGGELLSTTVPADLADGTYVANYRAVSDDGHPISGAIVFGIGDGTTIDDTVRDLAATTSAGLEAASAIARFVTYLGALLAAGLAVFVAFVHDQRDDRRRLDRLTRIAVGVGAIGTAAWIVFQAAVSTSDGLGSVLDPSTLTTTLADGLGWQAALTFIGLAAVFAAVNVSRQIVAQSLAFYGLLAVAFSFIFWGHARQAPNAVVAQASIFVHVAAGSVWFGGLVALAITLVGRRQARRGGRGREAADRPDESGLALSTAEVVVRFSTVAAWTAVALVVAGLVLTWQEVGSIDSLVSTDYGRLVAAKMAVVVVVLTLASFNRVRLVRDVARAGIAASAAGPGPSAAASSSDPASGPARSDQAPDEVRSWARLSRIVGVEGALLVVAFAFTSVLVSVTPARTTIDQPIVNLTITQDDLLVNLVVLPAQTGRNSLHIQYSDEAGRPVDSPRSLEVSMLLDEKGIGPLDVDVIKGGPGHFLAEDARIPVAGTWEITLVGRVSDFESSRTVFSVPIADR